MEQRLLFQVTFICMLTQACFAKIDTKQRNVSMDPPFATLAPSSLTASGEGSQIILSWKEMPDAETYEIYRSKTVPFNLATDFLTTTSRTTYVDSGQSPHSTWNYLIIGVDAYGHKSQASKTITATLPNRLPKFENLAPQTVKEGNSMTLTLAATDEDGDPLTFSCQAPCPNGLSVAPNGKVVWRPTLQNIGSHHVTFLVNDGYDSVASAPLAIDVTGRFYTNMPAYLVLGQDDFNGSAANNGQAGAVRNGLSAPDGVVTFEGKLFISEHVNHRVDFFNTIPTTNGANIDYVWGQPDFNANTPGDGTSGMATTRTPAYIGKEFFIADNQNDRILGFNQLPTSHLAVPDFVIGQPDFTSYLYNQNDGAIPGPNTLRGAFALSLFLLEDKLLVVDRGNYRVLVFKKPYSTNMNASLVLGQPDMVSANLHNPPTAKSMESAGGIWSDGKRILLADAPNNRVLLWNTFPTANYQAADIVIGQADMVSNGANRGGAVGADTLNWPFAVTSDGARIFIADSFNSRVLVYNSFPKTNGVSADAVIGQKDFTSTTHAAGQRGVNNPTNLWFDNGHLLVVDQSNHRILFFGE